MKAGFLEVSRFTDWVTKELSEEEYVELQKALLERPTAGAVIPGCGGVRKLRLGVGKQAKGKRGGARIIYFYFEESRLFLMLAGYSKNVQSDLTPAIRKLIVQLTREFCEQYRKQKGSTR